MSFKDLAEEILSKIAQYTAAAHYFDSIFYERLFFDHGDALIWCEDIRLAALASVNSRMRRICLPVLFARVRIRLSQNDTYSPEAVRRLCLLVRQRAHIAFYITTLGPSLWGPMWTPHDEESESLAKIIPLLPRLSQVTGRTLRVNTRLLEAINNHEHLQNVTGTIHLADEIFFQTTGLNLSKIWHSYEKDCHSPNLASRLALGMNVVRAIIPINTATVQLLHTTQWNQLRSIYFLFNESNAQYAGEFTSWLPVFVSNLSLNISEIGFTYIGSEYAQLDIFLSLFEGLNAASDGNREPQSLPAHVASYVIKRSSSQFPPTPRCSHSPCSIQGYDWKRDCTVTDIILHCHESSISTLSRIFPWLSDFAPMASEIEINGNYLKSEEQTFTTMEQLVVGIETFKNLRKISFTGFHRNAFSGSNGDSPRTKAELRSALANFSVSLKDKCPSLDVLLYGVQGFAEPYRRSLLTLYVNIHVRNQLLQDGGGIAYHIS